MNQTCVAPASREQAAALLSQTGCVEPSEPQQPAATLIPYGIASPLWSDGAAKQRFFALPDAATIVVEDDGDWTFPDGSVLVKTFLLGGRFIETRLLVKIDAFNWWGFSYEWREDQSDADLLPANDVGFERTITSSSGTQTWHFPSRSQCLQCHTDAAGRSLGPETSQLNFDFEYPSGITSNQVETLAHIGVFSATPEARAAYPDPADATQPPDVRARSYLHANCSICHRPGGESSVTFDLRFDTPFADTDLCDVAPQSGDLGVAGALRIAPGDPSRSVVSLRMKTLDTNVRMPRIGTRVVDEQGVAVIDAWISSLSGCP
jgi:uncharacterized repeat protein (TIGR03806 family)